MDTVDQDTSIKDLIETSRTIAIVGLSPDIDKPSNGVARYLKERGYRIIPVNPAQDEILGEKSYKSLRDITEKVDIVDIFIRPDKVVPFVEDAVFIQPRAIWLQLGIKNDEAKEMAGRAGITFIQDRCVKQEHTRLVSKP